MARTIWLVGAGSLCRYCSARFFKLRAVDARSGYEIFNQDMQASLEDVVVLPASEWLDNAPPYPISGSPVRFYLMAMAPGKQSLDVGISAEVTDEKDGDGNLLPDQEITITFEAGSLKLESEGEAEVKLLALDSGLTDNSYDRSGNKDR